MISSKLKPFMSYLETSQLQELRRFSKRSKIPMSQLIREAVSARLAQGDRYVVGYNKALHDAIEAIGNNKASKMKFPSGKSFADVFTEELERLMIKETYVQASFNVPRGDEGSAGNEDEGDPSLGV